MFRLVIASVLAAAGGLAAGYHWGSTSAAPALFPAETGPAVARFRGGRLTASEMRERLGELARTAGVAALGPAQKQAFADDVIRTALLSHEAMGRGLFKDPPVAALVRQTLAKRLIEKEFDENPQRQAFDEDELRGYYEAHRAEFSRPEKVRVSHLFLSGTDDDKALRRRKRQEIDKLRKELAAAPPQDYAAFAAKARALSEDEDTREQGGDLGALSRAEMDEKMGAEFTPVAWLMVRLGEISTVIETPRGFHLAKLHGREGALDVSFDQARETLRSRLWYERRSAEIEKFVAGLKTSLALTVDDAELEKVLAEFGPRAP